jgi:hypothetical protein
VPSDARLLFLTGDDVAALWPASTKLSPPPPKAESFLERQREHVLVVQARRRKVAAEMYPRAEGYKVAGKSRQIIAASQQGQVRFRRGRFPPYRRVRISAGSGAR